MKVVVICGPTAAGKTALAIDLARSFGGEIIGADSMQIYRQMDIGTAKPTPEERSLVPHHMIDVCDPDAVFDAAQYARMAREVAARLLEKGVLPFVVGGTGLYLRAFLYGLFEEGGADPGLRERLRAEAEERGTGALLDRLGRIDPETAARLHPNDTYRIIRALEVHALTGETMAEHRAAHRFRDAPYRSLQLGLELPREILYDRIDRRVDLMIGAGFVEEVRGLLDRGYPETLKSMQSIGYRHLADALGGRVSMAEALDTLKRDTRRYAKRQMTWFRAVPGIRWVSPGAVDDCRLRIASFLEARHDGADGRPA